MKRGVKLPSLMAVTEKEDFNENDSYVVAVPKNKVALKQHIAYYYPQWKLVDCDTILSLTARKEIKWSKALV